MKAWQVKQHGEPASIEWIDTPIAEPAPDEVQIRVEALGVNHLDVWVCKGVPGHRFPLPMIPGCDVTGVIHAMGAVAQARLASEGLAIGAPVLVNPGISCGRCVACLDGFDPICPQYGILGETRDGGAAEFVNVPLANVVARPKGLSALEAAALPIPFLTAWTMLFRKAGLKPGETILIHAGGSGVSVAAIQMAKMIGATVITTVGSDSKATLASDLGADHVINYKTGSFRESLKKILAPLQKRGVEVVVDHVGAGTFEDSVKSLAWGGRLVTCGATSGAEVRVDLKPVFFKNLSILGSTMGSKADLLRIVSLVGQGKLKPVIDSVLPMNDYPRALERLARREAFGKVVIAASTR